MRADPGAGAPAGRDLHLLMTADAVGGVWTYAVDLAAGLAERGVRTTLAVLGPSPTPEQRGAAEAIAGLRLIDTGLPLDWTAERPELVEAAGRSLAALAIELRPDLIQLNSPALAGAGQFDAPVAAVAHSCVKTWWRAVKGSAPLPPDLAWRAALTARGYAAADAVVAPTAAFAQATAAAYAIAPPEVVWNGRATPAFAPMSADPAPFAFTAGRLWDEGKGMGTLDAAAALTMARVHAAGPTRSPQGPVLEAERLHLLGSLPGAELASSLARRPVFVSPAFYEPFGLAVVEAAQAGCALVLSDIPSFRELWDGAAAFAPPGDAAAFARAIDGLMAEPKRRAVAAALAQERASRYTVQGLADGMLAIYARLTGQGERRVGAAA